MLFRQLHVKLTLSYARLGRKEENMSKKKKKETLSGKLRAFSLKVKYIPKKTKKKILVWSLSSVAIAAVVVLGGISIYNVLMDTVFKPNDIFYKDSYTVSDDKAVEKKDAVVATVGEGELTNGLLKMFYWNSAVTFRETYESVLSLAGLDLSKPLDEQTEKLTNTYTWQQYFILDAMNYWRRWQCRADAAKKENMELSEQLQTKLDTLYDDLTKYAKEDGYENAEEMIKEQIGAGVTFEDYAKYYELRYWSDTYYYAVLESLEVSMDEIEKYFTENEKEIAYNYEITKESGVAGTIRQILIKPEDENGDGKISAEEWQSCLEIAEETLQEWKDVNGTAEGFAEMAKNMSDDEKTKEDGGLMEGIYSGSSCADALKTWITDATRQTGDTGIVQTASGYHILYYVSGEEAWITCSRELALYKKLNDRMNEVEASFESDVNYKAIALDEMILLTATKE